MRASGAQLRTQHKKVFPMVPGAGWEAQYAVHNTDGTWDTTTYKNLPVIVWNGDESGNITGWVVSPTGTGDEGGALKSAPTVTFTAMDGRTLSFLKYVP
jgi:hypothetical protein